MNKTIIRLVGAALVAALVMVATSMSQNFRIASAIVIGLPSFLLMLISRRQLGKSFSIMPAAKTLVTSGLYKRIQHPMYFFLDLFLAAVIIILNWPILLWIWAIIVIVQVLQARQEEKVLATAFGTDYDAYRNQTWL